MSKLQNIKAIQQMLDGTHKSQTRKTISYALTKDAIEKNKKREVGEKWIEKGPTGFEYEWEQCDGFRVKKAANSVLDEINEVFSFPQECPECNSNMHEAEERLNKKMYFKFKKCFSCVLKEETKLRHNKENCKY